jgi:hypothetical protein
VSRGAVKNPDRRRELREVEVPPLAAREMEPGTRAFRMGPCSVLVSRQANGWHLSIARKDRLPSWEEARDARYALVPDEATMALLLPPRADYVNVHEFCLQMYEVAPEWLATRDFPLSGAGSRRRPRLH